MPSIRVVGRLRPTPLLTPEANERRLVIAHYDPRIGAADKDPAMFLVKLRTQETPVRPESVNVPALEDAVKIALENRPDARGCRATLRLPLPV